MSRHPMDEGIGLLVRKLQLRTIPPLDAEVVLQDGQTVDLKLLVDKKLRKLWELDQGLQGVPLALQGCWQVQLAPGARVVLEFLDGDVGKPIVRTLLSGTILSADLGALDVRVGGGGSTVKLAGGSQPVIRAGDANAGLLSAAPGSPVTGVYGSPPPAGKVLA